MKTTVNGLVLKEVKLREADRILTLLTPELGIISVSARGSLRPKSKLFSASNLFSYSEWTLHEGKSIFSVDEATPIEVFFGLRESIEAVSVAAYMAEMLQIFSPTGQEAGVLLKLALNSFYLMSEKKKEPHIVKSVFELRSLSESGYQPDLEACGSCGSCDELAFFDFGNGVLLCADCAGKKAVAPNISVGVLSALRHIVGAPDEKLYGFSLGSDNQNQLYRLAESYVLFHMDYPPKTLAFLKTVLEPNVLGVMNER